MPTRLISNNIKGQIHFLSLVGGEVPESYSGQEMQTIVGAFLKYVSDGEKTGRLSPNLLGYLRITLGEATRDPDLRESLVAWGSRFNLQSSWCLDFLLETLAIFLVMKDSVQEALARAWCSALVQKSADIRGAMHGPILVFSHTWLPRLSKQAGTPFEIEHVVKNPIRVFEETFLQDVREKFADFVVDLMRNDDADPGENNRWSSLLEITRELDEFERKLDRFAAKARKSMKVYLEEVRRVHEPNNGPLWTVTRQVRDRQISRNLLWLTMYQVKRMSYGEIAAAEEANEKTVIDGVKAGARLIELTLRSPNKAGRKKGSRTQNPRG